jgi:folate-binding protein YgfZ
MIALLDDRSVIALAGADARSLLQGLVTNDMEQLSPASALYAALLTPQGKILFDFLMVEGDGAVLLDCPQSRAEMLVRRLTIYRLRAKVEIELRPQLKVLAAWQGETLPGISFADPRLPQLGIRSVVAAAEVPAGAGPAGPYHSHRRGLGVPEGEDFGSDAIFALDGDLEQLHAVSFTKGCYVGQELTARMKHRGTARKRLLAVSAPADLPPAGTAVTAGEKSIGEITSVNGHEGFALIRLDRLEEASGAPLSAGGVELRLAKPAWLFA